LFTSGSNDLRGSLHLCGLPYRAFLGLGFGPQTEASPRAACFSGHSQVQHPGICLHPVVVPKEDACPVHTEDTQDTERRRHRYLDTFASQDRRTKCTLDLSLNGVVITSFDPRFPARSAQNGGRVGPFSQTVWAVSETQIVSAVLEWGTSCTLCPRQTGDPASLADLFPCCHSPTPRRCGSVFTVVSSSLGHSRPYCHHQIQFN
jgi:hypothetical protein